MLERPGPDGKPWTRKRFASALGLRDDSQVYRWLRGEVTPGGEYLRRMAALFGESPPTLRPPGSSDAAAELRELREAVMRLEQAFRELAESREGRYDALVAGQQEVVRAVERALEEIPAAASTHANAGTKPSPSRRRKAS